MPMPDPLDQIMNVLKAKGTVDPNQAAARSAKIKSQRTTMGANPQATKKPPYQGVKKNMPPDVMPATPNAPQGISPDFQANPNMMSVVVDALNEGIIGLKTEIHRANDPETRKNLERQAKQLRQQIVDMGGEPIYADESIDEGLKKLRGHGAIAAHAGSAWFGPSPAPEDPKPTTTTTTKKPATAAAPPPADTIASLLGQVPARPGSPMDSLFGSTMSVQTPTVRAPQVKVPEIPGPMTADSGPNYFGEHVADPTRDGAVDELEELIGRVTGREINPPPEITVTPETVNELITQYGLEPRTPEEIAETARVIVERQKLSREQLVQREIERFERDHEHEFAKAQKQVTDAASRASADRQEEMAARGMFYSSIMGNSIEEIDETALTLISDIARDAANKVSELHADIRDIGQWAILEEEFVRREMESQEREHSKMLMSMHLEVATWGDQMRLDQWYKQNTLQLQADQTALQGVQVKMQYAEQQGQNLAAAFMADHPLVQNTLVGMGISPDKFAGMSLEQQAGLVRTTMGFNEVEQQMRMNELQMRAVVAEIALKNAQLSLQAQIATGQFAMQGMGMAMEMAMHRDKMDLAWANYGLDAQAQQWAMSGGSGGSGGSVGISNSDFYTALSAGQAGTRADSQFALSLRDQMSPEQQARYDSAMSIPNSPITQAQIGTGQPKFNFGDLLKNTNPQNLPPNNPFYKGM